MATIKSLAVSITANTTKFEKGIKKAMRQIKAFAAGVRTSAMAIARLGTIMAGAAIAGATALTLLVNKVTQMGDLIAKNSKRLGQSAEFVSALGFAAERSGASMESAVKGIRVFARYVDEAASGTKEYKEIFDRLGITVTDTSGKIKPLKTLFLQAADGIARLKDESERLSLAQQLFGRGGTEMLPMLMEGSRGIARLMNDAKRLGGVWSQVQADMAEKYQDAWTDMKAAMGGFTREFVGAVLPAYTDGVKRMTMWLVQHREEVVNRLTVAWEWAKVKVTAFGATLLEVARSGSVDAWIKRIHIGLIGIVGVAKIAYQSISALLKIAADPGAAIESVRLSSAVKETASLIAIYKRVQEEGIGPLRAELEALWKQPWLSPDRWAWRNDLQKFVADFDWQTAGRARAGESIMPTDIARNAIKQLDAQLKSQRGALAETPIAVIGRKISDTMKEMLDETEKIMAGRNIIADLFAPTPEVHANIGDLIKLHVAGFKAIAEEGKGWFGQLFGGVTDMGKQAAEGVQSNFLAIAPGLERGTAAARSSEIRWEMESRGQKAAAKPAIETAKNTKTANIYLDKIVNLLSLPGGASAPVVTIQGA